MTAFYIGQHEIDDETTFADYLKQTIPFIEKHGGRYLTKAGTHEIARRPTTEPRRRCRISEQAGDQGLVQRSRLPALVKPKRHAAARSIMIAVECQ